MIRPPRDAPALHIIVPLEGAPVAYVAADTAEDAARLREQLLTRPLAVELQHLVNEQVPEIRSRRP